MKRNELIGILYDNLSLGIRAKLLFRKLGYQEIIMTNEFYNFREMVKHEKPYFLVVDLALIMKEKDSSLVDWKIPTICMTYANLPEEMTYCTNMQSAVAYCQKPINKHFVSFIDKKVADGKYDFRKTMITNFHLSNKLTFEKYNN